MEREGDERWLKSGAIAADPADGPVVTRFLTASTLCEIAAAVPRTAPVLLIDDVGTSRGSGGLGSSATVGNALAALHNQEQDSHRPCATFLEAPADCGESIPQQK